MQRVFLCLKYKPGFNFTVMSILFQIFYLLVLLPISKLNDKWRYFISDVLYIMVSKLIQYRKKMIDKNLANSFPDKTIQERIKLRKEYYRHFCDLLVESILCFSITKQNAIDKCELVNPEVLQESWNTGQDVVIISGHYGNWELTTLGVTPQLPFQLITQYKPLKNQFINDFMVQSRTRFGLNLIKQHMSWPTHNGKKPHGHIFLADHSALKSKHIYWLNFLNQMTAVASRPEWIAKRQKAAVFFIAMEKKQRGYYQLTLTPICRDASLTDDGWITKKYTKLLEELIIKNPPLWLWSHNRWKMKPQ